MSSRQTLSKTLKPHWVWAIALGSSIGWGAFVQPTNWMAAAGPFGVILGFIIGALLMLIIAVSYGFLIRSFPVTGGEFAYAFVSLGRTHAFISGWFLVLGYICIVALNASALALMFKFVFPAFIENFHFYNVAGWKVYGMEVLVASLALVLFGYLNIRGASFSGRMQFLFCSIMVLSVVVLTFMVGAQPMSGFANVTPAFPTDKTAVSAIIIIVAMAPWAYVGFDNIPQAAEEFNFSSKKAFTLIVLAIIFAALLYCLMVLATAMAAPWQELVNSNHLWGTGTIILETVGVVGLIILITALTMGIFTGLNGFTLSSSRLLFAMSRAKILPESFSKLHPKYNTPYVSIIFTVIIAMIAPWFGREALLWVVDMSSIGVTIAYFYTCYTAFYLYKWSEYQKIDPSRNLISPVKKMIAFFGMSVSLIFLALLLIPGSPAFLGVESRIALVIWIFLGLIIYFKKRKQLNDIDDQELNYLILGNEKIEITK